MTQTQPGKHHFAPATVGSLPAQADPTGPPYCMVCQLPQANSRHTMMPTDDPTDDPTDERNR